MYKIITKQKTNLVESNVGRQVLLMVGGAGVELPPEGRNRNLAHQAIDRLVP